MKENFKPIYEPNQKIADYLIPIEAAKEKSKLMRKLDPRQRKALELFMEFELVTSKQIGELFGFKPRTSSALCKKWVEAGFLKVADKSFKTRKYSLADKFEVLVDTNP
ncbi:hypothetical protein ACFLY6_00475 [Candidatus Dependentiae bacterium]